MTVIGGYGDATYGARYYGVGALTPDAAFTVDVFVNGQWLDIGCDVRSVAVDRGRSRQLDNYTAGTATVVLDNRSDRYNAWNKYSVWGQAGTFRTDVPLRVRAVVGGVTFGLFSGTTDQVADSWPDAGADAETVVQATDAFKGLARARIPLAAAAGAGEKGGARIGRILDAAAYTGPRAIDAGVRAFQGETFDAVAIDLLDEAREAEWGGLFVDGAGVVTFRDRNALTTDPRLTNVQWTFVDRDADITGATQTCYSDLVLAASDERVVNKATATATGGVAQTAQVADSVAWFGPRTWTRTDLPLQSDTDVLTLAQLVVADLAYNERRIDAVVFDPLDHTNGTAVAVGLRLLDRVRVLRHTAGGTVIDAELLAQGIHHQITPAGFDRLAGAWTVTVETTNALAVRDAGFWDVDVWDTGQWSA